MGMAARRGLALHDGQAASTAFQLSGAVLPAVLNLRSELTPPDAMHEFDAGDGDRRMSEALESEHRTQTKLDGSVILFDQIIQVFSLIEFESVRRLDAVREVHVPPDVTRWDSGARAQSMIDEWRS
jgi:hypothetical protein